MQSRSSQQPVIAADAACRRPCSRGWRKQRSTRFTHALPACRCPQDNGWQQQQQSPGPCVEPEASLGAWVAPPCLSGISCSLGAWQAGPLPERLPHEPLEDEDTEDTASSSSSEDSQQDLLLLLAAEAIGDAAAAAQQSARCRPGDEDSITSAQPGGHTSPAFSFSCLAGAPALPAAWPAAPLL